MSVTQSEVELAYRLFLGRSPSRQEIERMQESQQSLNTLRQVFINSAEFARSYNGVKNQSASKEARVLVHLHIPKTAGSSLTNVLQQAVSPEERFTVGDNDLEKLRAMSPVRRKQLRFVFGHLSHGVGELLPNPCSYICVLRRPGPRLLSFYNYIKRTDHHPLHEALQEADMTFGKFLHFTTEVAAARPEVDNGQVRRLAGNYNPHSKETLGQLLQAALHNIMAPNMTYGLTEHFDDFLKILVVRNIIPSFAPARDNAAPEPADLAGELERLTPAQRNIYDAYTKWDEFFYSVCHEIYFSSKDEAARS